jgi:uncharacterized protein (TIGR03435 family)
MVKLQALFMVCAVAAASAQSPPSTTKPSFEVASVKPNKSGEQGMSLQTQLGGRFTATNVPLSMLIRNAYELQAQQLVGLPDWTSSERFDILATAGKDIPQNKEGAIALH